MSREPVWLPRSVVLAIHEQLIAEHGGATGEHDEGRLGLALSRPLHRQAYPDSDLFRLAAGYAFGIARNDPFRDGNKRVALTLAGVFLEMNGWRLEAPEADAATSTLALAAGELDEGAYALWLEGASVPKEIAPPR